MHVHLRFELPARSFAPRARGQAQRRAYEKWALAALPDVIDAFDGHEERLLSDVCGRLGVQAVAPQPGGLGDLDIWTATRPSRDAPWAKPVALPALNSPAKDIPRPTGQFDRVMPVGSDREERGRYQMYFATRSENTEAFATPAPVPELVFGRESTVDGFLTEDGLSLFFCSGFGLGAADLYVVTRRSLEDPFELRAPLHELNSPFDERDPWLSADGSEFYFASDRTGQYNIYVAQVRP